MREGTEARRREKYLNLHAVQYSVEHKIYEKNLMTKDTRKEENNKEKGSCKEKVES